MNLYYEITGFAGFVGWTSNFRTINEKFWVLGLIYYYLWWLTCHVSHQVIIITWEVRLTLTYFVFVCQLLLILLFCLFCVDLLMAHSGQSSTCAGWRQDVQWGQRIQPKKYASTRKIHVRILNFMWKYTNITVYMCSDLPSSRLNKTSTSIPGRSAFIVWLWGILQRHSNGRYPWKTARWTV